MDLCRGEWENGEGRAQRLCNRRRIGTEAVQKGLSAFPTLVCLFFFPPQNKKNNEEVFFNDPTVGKFNCESSSAVLKETLNDKEINTKQDKC